MSIHPKQAVEHFHLLFLEQFSAKIDKNLYALKGGCNLRFFFNSIRYSEDIDLDVHTTSSQTLQKNVESILGSQPFKMKLLSNQIEISSFSASKQTHLTQRWKIQLSIRGSMLPINTKIEFSRRNIAGIRKFEALNSTIISEYNVKPFLINHYDGPSALVQKIDALANRTETQARDIFDLYLLIAQNVRVDRLSEATRSHIPLAIENASNIGFAEYKSQVVSYLLFDHQRSYDSHSLWDDIVLSVIGYLESTTR